MIGRSPYVGVIGAGECTAEENELATDLGREVARAGAVLVCGGLGGVMTAAARGAKEIGGITIGILPGPGIEQANDYIDYPIATNMGQARNAVIVQTAGVLISVAGGYGTLSEIAMARKIGRTVICLKPRFDVPGVLIARTAREAMALAMEQLCKT